MEQALVGFYLVGGTLQIAFMLTGPRIAEYAGISYFFLLLAISFSLLLSTAEMPLALLRSKKQLAFSALTFVTSGIGYLQNRGGIATFGILPLNVWLLGVVLGLVAVVTGVWGWKRCGLTPHCQRSALTNRLYVRLLLLFVLSFSLVVHSCANPIMNGQLSIAESIYCESATRLLLPTSKFPTLCKYSLDGNDPAVNPGKYSFRTIGITGTTVVRLRVYALLRPCSELVAFTKVFPRDVPQQGKQPNLRRYSDWAGVPADYEMDSKVLKQLKRSDLNTSLRQIPVVCISLPPEDMFGHNGLYVNPQARGRDWERKCSFEFFEESVGGVTASAGLRIHGNSSRSPLYTKKHSMRLYFRSEYGPSKLKYDLFEGSDVAAFDRLVLRGNFNDSWCRFYSQHRALLVRDEFSRRLFREMEQLSPQGRFVHVYINALYWGVYSCVERPDAHFVSAHLGGNPDDWDVIDSGDVSDGVDESWKAFLEAAEHVPNTDACAILSKSLGAGGSKDSSKGLLNVANFIDYVLLNVYLGNSDWLDYNYIAFRRRVPDSSGFTFIVWDAETSLGLSGNVDDNPLNNMDRGIGKVFLKLVKSEEFRLMLADRIQELFVNESGLFACGSIDGADEFADARKSRSAQLFDEICAEVEVAIVAESARWGDQYSEIPFTKSSNWTPERNRLVNEFFPARTRLVVQFLKDAGLFSPAPKVTIRRHESDESVYVISIDKPEDMEVFYTTDGSDPRSKRANVSSLVGTSEIAAPAVIKARSVTKGEWSALRIVKLGVPSDVHVGVVISEIHYHPAKPNASEANQLTSLKDESFEFIELCNISGEDIDLQGMRIAGGISFTFSSSESFQLAPMQRLVLVSNKDAFVRRYGDKCVVAGQYHGKLNNSGEALFVLADDGSEIMHVHYDDDNGWPTEADGAGYSLEAITTSGALNRAESWKVSNVIGGSPGF